MQQYKYHTVLLLVASLLLVFHVLTDNSNESTVNSTALLQVHVISRHCDHLPATEEQIPNDPVNWTYVYPDLIGNDLTPEGQQQCHTLGDLLRARYLLNSSTTHIQNISSHYNDMHYEFRSTNYTRTLNSMVAILSGLFPSETVPRTTVITVNNEPLLLGVINCTRMFSRYNQAIRTQVPRFINTTRQFVDQLYEQTGWMVEDDDEYDALITLFDLLVAQVAHNRSHIEWVNDNWQNIMALRDGIVSLLFSYNVVGKEGSSKLISTLIDDMTTMKKKYFQYSGHDATLQALTGALKLNLDVPELGGQPDYGAHIVFELHQMNDGKKAVRILHGSQYDSSELTPLVLKSLGCNTEYCPLDTFKAITDGVSRTANYDQACRVRP